MGAVPGIALTAHVYARLRDEIISGQLLSGAPLVETSLARRLEVSRTPVREALRLLSHDGFVDTSGRTTRVASRSAQALFDIYDVRIPLEAAAARGAAERHTTFDRMQMTRLHDAWTNVDTSDLAALAVANRAFHDSVWTATHNNALIDFLHRLDLYLRLYPVTALHQAERSAVSKREHWALLQAILQRDVDGASELAKAHFTEARDVRLEFYDSVSSALPSTSDDHSAPDEAGV